MNIIQRYAALALAWTLALASQGEENKVQPATVHGVIRSKYEYQPQMNKGRFEVRNARVNLCGSIHPLVDYKAEIDLSDEGAIKMLDAYTRLHLSDQLSLTAGQMRVPFTIDAHRSPAEQYFANRSFIAKQVGNVRDVGATLAYTTTVPFPITFQGGCYNGSGLTRQKIWHDNVNYSARLIMNPNKHWNLTLSTQNIKPDSVRIFSWGAGLYYEANGWHIEAEYLLKHYQKKAFTDVSAIDAFASYCLPLKKTFRQISFLARYDYMDNHSDGMTLKNGRLTLTDYNRHRFTGGITLRLGSTLPCDIRLNYEKYVYPNGGIAKDSEQDKFVIELCTLF